MKVKEYLYEKFVEDSDPIADMNIGMKHQIKKWIETETEYKYIEKDLLWICAKAGKTEFIKYLLDTGADVHAENDYALQLASYRGHDKVVKLLLDAGADVHTGDDYSLRWASNNGHDKVVKLLLDAGADVHVNDHALRWASSNGHDKVVKILRDHIAKEKKLKESLNEKFVEDSDPITDMNIGMKHQIKKWVETETEYKYIEKDLLWICAQAGKTEFVKYLLDTGADVHAENDLALQWASSDGHDKVVKLLLDAGADVHADNDYALGWASSNGHDKVVKILRDHIAKEKKLKESLVEKFTEDSDPIADMGIGMKHLIKKWIENENIYLYDENDYYRLLQICVVYNKVQFVKFLFKNYIDFIDLNKNENAILRIAAFYKKWKVSLILIEYGANLETAIKSAKQLYELITTHNLYKIKDALEKNKTDSLIDEMFMGVGATPGIGNITPATTAATSGTQMSSPSSTGSGDNFGNTLGNRLYTQNKSVKTRNKRRRSMRKKKYVKEDVNEKFTKDSDPIKDMNIGITGLWDYSIEEAAKEIWILMKPRIQQRIAATQRFNKPYTVSPRVITERGCEDLGFEPNKHTLRFLVKLVQREIEKSIENHTLNIPSNVKYLKINEENLNPYDKLGMYIAKKMKIKPPFKKKRSKKNQSAMVQRKFEHNIVTFDEYSSSQLNENK